MPVNDYEDVVLVKALRKGDIDAFNQLYKKYNLKIFYFIRGYLGSKEDAEELIQEIFMTIWETRNRLKEQLSFNAYLFTITHNAILKFYRNKGSRQKLLNHYLSGQADHSNKTLHDVEYESLVVTIQQYIEKLPPKRKNIFRLSRDEGLGNKEIAEQLGLSVRTVEAHIYQAIKYLRRHLEKEYFVVLLLFYIMFY